MHLHPVRHPNLDAVQTEFRVRPYIKLLMRPAMPNLRCSANRVPSKSIHQAFRTAVNRISGPENMNIRDGISLRALVGPSKSFVWPPLESKNATPLQMHLQWLGYRSMRWARGLSATQSERAIDMVKLNISQHVFAEAELRFLIPTFQCPRTLCFWSWIF